MSDEPIRASRISLIDIEWYRQLGEVAASIGTEIFHRKLLSLFALCIESDSGWIIRYSRVAPPDVLYTDGVPSEIVEFYNKKCLRIDPFSLYWKTFGKPGVLTLSEIGHTSPESILYGKIFRPAANISDELGMFFPTVGHCCFGLFLERQRSNFSQDDVRRAELIFPALEGCHRSHLGNLFSNLRYTDGSQADGLLNRPTLIRDRHHEEVFANESWKQAVLNDTSILSMLETLAPSDAIQTVHARNYVITSEVFDRDFALAPGGRIFMLGPKPAAQDDLVSYRAAADVLVALTPRERDILALAMKGQATGQIAQALEISKGTIKNCKIRIYRKADVTSERDLIKKFSPFFPST
ncbi:LuxR family transcriptional regulator [Methylobacterium sp. BTF04]|uniref:helix-turn-helix transcriptional regulator n=1 Tax=Methylobacterium sp. BTF04 TaxID=2708300 RepID=UPI0013D3A63D|nr:LuxR C-terminal-related transcriptional regulator [Methylobacterium sp. BTF04]NEU14754.1 LuxR family transcriptional regulator [Methylobacterium sp. BTF04]